MSEEEVDLTVSSSKKKYRPSFNTLREYNSSGSEERFAIKRLYERLRGIAVKKNIAIATATQTNKSGASAKLVTEKDSTESYTKIAISDYVLTYSQTLEEHKLGFARLFTDKGRDDAAKFLVLISQAYGVGQFLLSSSLLDDNYESYIKGSDYDDFDDDDDYDD